MSSFYRGLYCCYRFRDGKKKKRKFALRIRMYTSLKPRKSISSPRRITGDDSFFAFFFSIVRSVACIWSCFCYVLRWWFRLWMRCVRFRHKAFQLTNAVYFFFHKLFVIYYVSTRKISRFFTRLLMFYYGQRGRIYYY